MTSYSLHSYSVFGSSSGRVVHLTRVAVLPIGMRG